LEIDAAARQVIPNMSPLKASTSISHHLRYIRSLITADEDGEIYFHDYTSTVHKARYDQCELTELEYEHAMEAFDSLKRM
jgi:hypothetical protein